MAEATLKHSKDVLSTEKKNHKALVKAWEEVRRYVRYIDVSFAACVDCTCAL